MQHLRDRSPQHGVPRRALDRFGGRVVWLGPGGCLRPLPPGDKVFVIDALLLYCAKWQPGRRQDRTPTRHCQTAKDNVAILSPFVNTRNGGIFALCPDAITRLRRAPRARTLLPCQPRSCIQNTTFDGRFVRDRNRSGITRSAEDGLGPRVPLTHSDSSRNTSEDCLRGGKR